ncbi:MAG: hypothetical protein AAGH68_12765 [Pseudomonadota bacterium]
MMRFALLAAMLLIAACANRPAPQPAKIQHPEEAESIVVLVSKTGQPARDLMHFLAASCWLDGVVRGAQLIVKPGGNIEIVGDKYLLVAADYLGLKGARSRWKLTGAALRDPYQRRRLVETLDRAVKTGDTTCPPIV